LKQNADCNKLTYFQNPWAKAATAGQSLVLYAFVFFLSFNYYFVNVLFLRYYQLLRLNMNKYSQLTILFHVKNDIFMLNHKFPLAKWYYFVYICTTRTT
jgi:hypothetical protein